MSAPVIDTDNPAYQEAWAWAFGDISLETDSRVTLGAKNAVIAETLTDLKQERKDALAGGLPLNSSMRQADLVVNLHRTAALKAAYTVILARIGQLPKDTVVPDYPNTFVRVAEEFLDKETFDRLHHETKARVAQGAVPAAQPS